ncbi:hypothetical protein C8R46DRAFT_1277217 [Mycena filopes]|nr:hypothetical protein C8R46DRAFT_1277217 [Mycena filopes]
MLKVLLAILYLPIFVVYREFHPTTPSPGYLASLNAPPLCTSHSHCWRVVKELAGGVKCRVVPGSSSCAPWPEPNPFADKQLLNIAGLVFDIVVISMHTQWGHPDFLLSFFHGLNAQLLLGDELGKFKRRHCYTWPSSQRHYREEDVQGKSTSLIQLVVMIAPWFLVPSLNIVRIQFWQLLWE